MPHFPVQDGERTRRSVTAEAFACEFRAEGRGAAWVAPRGELDLASAPQFEEALQEALQQALLLIIDLRALTFIDSKGLQAIAAVDERAWRMDRRIVLIRGSGQVDRLFELVGFPDRLRSVDLTAGPFTTPIRGGEATGADRRDQR